MGSSELRGICIDGHHESFVSKEGIRDALSSSGISSASVSVSICSNSNANSDTNSLARKRNVPSDIGFSDLQIGSQLDDYEMDKIRRIMDHVDGDRRGSVSMAGSQRGSIEPSFMSTVFGVVLIIVISISVYAFASLYRAVMKRMNGS